VGCLLRKNIIKPFLSKMALNLGFPFFEVLDNNLSHNTLIDGFEDSFLFLQTVLEFILIKKLKLLLLTSLLNYFIASNTIKNSHINIRNPDHWLFFPAFTLHLLINLLQDLIFSKWDLVWIKGLLFLSFAEACQKLRFSTSFLSLCYSLFWFLIWINRFSWLIFTWLVLEIDFKKISSFSVFWLMLGQYSSTLTSSLSTILLFMSSFFRFLINFIWFCFVILYFAIFCSRIMSETASLSARSINFLLISC